MRNVENYLIKKLFLPGDAYYGDQPEAFAMFKEDEIDYNDSTSSFDRSYSFYAYRCILQPTLTA